jgi:hypothetical protein
MVSRFIIAKAHTQPKMISGHVQGGLPMGQSLNHGIISIIDIHATGITENDILAKIGDPFGHGRWQKVKC